MQKENIIEVKNLTKDYKKGRGIFNFTFDVKKGEIVGLVGTNGSGKTTTIRHMMGFIQGNKGSVTINGLDAWKDSAKIKKCVGYVSGQIDFPDVGTGTTFLKIQAELLGLKDLNYMNELIDLFKIDITAPLKRMSKGMKQKMAIVAAFMAQPDVYILDEPSTGLDPLMRDTLIGVIRKQKAQGKTIFMSSHIFNELEETCDSIIFIKDGHIVHFISRDEYDCDPHEAYTIGFQSKEGMEHFLHGSKRIPTEKMKKYLIHQNLANNKATINLPSVRLNDFFSDLSTSTIISLNHEPYSLEKYYKTIIEHQEVK